MSRGAAIPTKILEIKVTDVEKLTQETLDQYVKSPQESL
jgi:hypothetical protein